MIIKSIGSISSSKSTSKTTTATKTASRVVSATSAPVQYGGADSINQPIAQYAVNDVGKCTGAEPAEYSTNESPTLDDTSNDSKPALILASDAKSISLVFAGIVPILMNLF
jgi:hypothetical protein